MLIAHVDGFPFKRYNSEPWFASLNSHTRTRI